jgi:type VI secretion system protein ImpL
MKIWQAILKFIKGEHKIKLIFAILILLIIWLALPWVSINGLYPFASIGARITLTLIGFLGVGLWYGILFAQKHQWQSFTIVKQFALKIWNYLRNALQTSWQYSKEYYFDVHDRIKSDRKHRRLKRLPWYLILGAPNSGKRSFMQQSGLYFQRPEHLGPEALNYTEEFPDFEWWFTQQGIVVDVMTSDIEKDASAWKQFIKLLKRERKNRPFNGVILTLSLPQLLLQSNKERQAFVQHLAIYIRDIYSQFKAYVPVYIVFNQCDLLEGFIEFFENLSKEEINQVWGMTLPIQGCNDLQNVLNFFNQEYTALITQLRKRVMWAFDGEKTMRGRELIHAFPQQMLLFRKPIENLLAEIYGATRYQRAVQLRGLYFMSCSQGNGSPNDFLLHAMSKKFQLVRPHFQRLQRIGEAYFVRALFFEVLLPEANSLGDSERRKKVRHVMYRALLIACPVLILALGFGMHEAYVENQLNLSATQQYINQYNTNVGKISQGDPSLIDTLPALQSLQRAKALYTQDEPFSLHLLWASHSIKNTIAAAEQRALRSLFLTRIAAQLETDLKKNSSDQNVLYADLKGYLVFSADADAQQYALKAPLEYQWERDYIHQPRLQIALKSFLDQALLNSVGKLSLDQTLIGRIRRQLSQVDPAQRAYGLLTMRATLSNAQNLDILQVAGNRFAQVFVMNDDQSSIPSLYTKAAYVTVFRKQYEAIAEEVAEDNRVIGLSNVTNTKDDQASLAVSLQTTYNRNYIQSWNNALTSISVKSFTNLNQLVNALDVLTSNDSPMTRLLNSAYDNTSEVENDQVVVADYFKNLNNYSSNSGLGTHWRDTVKVLKQLHDYLVTLQAAPDQDQASFDAAKAVIQGKAKNPVKQLTEMANNAPEPVKHWLTSLADDSWKIILNGAHNKMNAAWNSQITPTYNSGMRDRFPLNSAAQSSVSMDAFNTLFGYGGALDKYFNDYLKPFINTDNDTWQLYNQQGLTIQIPAVYITIFQRAQTIREEFFPNGANQAQLNLTIKPLILDKQASSIQFAIGAQTIEYSHGPQNETSITWPLPFSGQASSVVLTTFSGDQYNRSADGPWSLFRIFHYGVFKARGDTGSYKFDLGFNNHNASFLITGPSNVNVFTLKDLIGYSLPTTIAPTFIEHKEKK